MSKKTLIIGATPDPTRYAYRAAHVLTAKGHPIVNIGIKKGEVAGVPIQRAGEIEEGVHTITLYVGGAHQPDYYDYIINTHPARVIFNPGAENEELENLLVSHGIEPVEACTLVLLSIGQY